MNKDLKRIADIYGTFHQLDKLIEEMAELTQAIIKVKYSSENMKNVISELADVANVYEQVVYLLKIEEEIKKERKYKIKRTLERLDINE